MWLIGIEVLPPNWGIGGGEAFVLWLISEICDDGRFGIVSEDNRIIIGIPNNITTDQLQRIVDAHNDDCAETPVRRENHKTD